MTTPPETPTHAAIRLARKLLPFLCEGTLSDTAILLDRFAAENAAGWQASFSAKDAELQEAKRTIEHLVGLIKRTEADAHERNIQLDGFKELAAFAARPVFDRFAAERAAQACVPLSFREELAQLINRRSLENLSGTPDFILAEYLVDCLCAFEHAVHTRELWHTPKRDAAMKASGNPTASEPVKTTPTTNSE